MSARMLERSPRPAEAGRRSRARRGAGGRHRPAGRRVRRAAARIADRARPPDARAVAAAITEDGLRVQPRRARRGHRRLGPAPRRRQRRATTGPPRTWSRSCGRPAGRWRADVYDAASFVDDGSSSLEVAGTHVRRRRLRPLIFAPPGDVEGPVVPDRLAARAPPRPDGQGLRRHALRRPPGARDRGRALGRLPAARPGDRRPAGRRGGLRGGLPGGAGRDRLPPDPRSTAAPGDPRGGRLAGPPPRRSSPRRRTADRPPRHPRPHGVGSDSLRSSRSLPGSEAGARRDARGAPRLRDRWAGHQRRRLGRRGPAGDRPGAGRHASARDHPAGVLERRGARAPRLVPLRLGPLGGGRAGDRRVRQRRHDRLAERVRRGLRRAGRAGRLDGRRASCSRPRCERAGGTPVGVDLGGGSDHRAFAEAGVATAGVFSGASDPVAD